MRDLLIIAAGLLTMFSGIMNWDWFINRRRSTFLVALLGRTGARLFFILLGMIVTSIGLLLATGVLTS